MVHYFIDLSHVQEVASHSGTLSRFLHRMGIHQRHFSLHYKDTSLCLLTCKSTLEIHSLTFSPPDRHPMGTSNLPFTFPYEGHP